MIIHLRVFGCLAMTYHTSVPHDKFAARGVPCVFLGFPPTKKGHHLLNLTIKTSFVSRDVKFHEEIFMFCPTFTSQYMHLVPVPMPHTANTLDEVFVSDLSRPPSLVRETFPPPSINEDTHTDVVDLRRSTRTRQPLV